MSQFFDTLRAEEVTQGAHLPAATYCLAAHMSLAKGDLGAGWRFLRKMAPPNARDLGAARFWQFWLDGWAQESFSGTADPVLTALYAVARQAVWRKACSPELVETLWDEFRKCEHHWILDVPLCRVVIDGFETGDSAG